MSREMTINTIISQLGDLRNSCKQKADIAACETSIRILATLVEEGCNDFEQVLDVFQDYQGLSKQYQAMHQRFQVAGKPVYRDGAWHCPDCHRRVAPSHSFCNRCGKKLDRR